VPLQPGHSTSVDTSLDFKLVMGSFLGHDADGFHVVVHYGLLAPIVPLQGHARPTGFGRRYSQPSLRALAVTPTASSDRPRGHFAGI
jgi:hypothetical protein